ncbi:MAG TPA: histidine phosphatase family protein [Anaerolineales bacterium]|nr:histidine phosphatase family protein [Anaerolineales bacterium]
MPKDEHPIHEITLLRHGESEGNAGGYYQGQADGFPLTERGREQVWALAVYWQSTGVTFDTCIASPLSRARETAEIIADILGLEVEIDPIWLERNNGKFAGLHNSEVEKAPRDERPTIYTPIGETGETEWELYLRGGRAMQSLLHRPAARYLVVSHGAILNATLRATLGVRPQAMFRGVWFHFRNAAFASLTYSPDSDRWGVYGVNQRPHWDDER